MLSWYQKKAPVTRKLQVGFGLVSGAAAIGACYAAAQAASIGRSGEESAAAARVGMALSQGQLSALEIADGLDALGRAVETGEAGSLDEARRLLAAHHAEADRALSSAMEFAVDDAERARLGEVREALDQFVNAALRANGGSDAELEAIMGDIASALAASQARGSEAGSAVSAQASEALALALGLAVVALLLGAAFSTLLSRLIATPLQLSASEMERVARGDLDFSVSGLDRADDAGRLAQALQTFRLNALEIRRLQQEQEALQARLAEERRVEMQRLAEGFERSVLSVVETVASASGELEMSAATLSRTAAESNERSDEVARAAQLSASNVQTVAAAAEEMSASAGEIAGQVSQATVVARDAEDRARTADQTVRELASAAQRIGDVINLITEIASQTNLLALNATIEAARAGEAGRGFAVVAAEVKRLAEQTARATEGIASQVAGIQTATDGVVQALDAISKTITEINSISTSVSAAVEQQTAAVREISRNTAEVAQGTRDVTNAIGAVRAGASETGAAAEQSLGAAQRLGQQAGVLREEVRRFIDQIRAA